MVSSSTVVSGTSVAAAIARIAASAVSRPRASTDADVDLQVAALRDDVRPRAAGDDADVDRHARPAAVEGVQLADDPGRLEDRAAALLRLDAGVGGPAVDRDPGVEDPLARRHDVAVRPGALEDEARVGVGARARGCGRRGGRPDLLVRVGDEHEPLERQPAELADDGLERIQPGEQAGLHVGHARAVGDAVLDAERARGRGPGIEHRVHVADEQDARRPGAAVERGDDRVAEPAVRVGPAFDAGAQLAGTPRSSAPTSSTPRGV